MNINLQKKSAILNLIFIGLSLFLFSCKKENKKEVTESYVTYEVNGKKYNYKSKTDLTFKFSGLYIQTPGKEKPTPHLHLKTPNLLIKVDNYKTPIEPGLYEGKTYNNEGWTREVFMSYMHTNDTTYQSAYHNPITETTINSISRSGVSGTFSGRVERITLVGLETLKITNGVFSIYTYEQ
jgi:hypothetical protein